MQSLKSIDLFTITFLLALATIQICSCKPKTTEATLAVFDAPEMSALKTRCQESGRRRVVRMTTIGLDEGRSLSVISPDACRRGASSGMNLADPTGKKAPTGVVIYNAHTTDQLISRGSATMIQQFRNSGFEVLEVPNQRGDELKTSIEKYRKERPELFAEGRQTLLFVDAHGHRDSADGTPYHSISTPKDPSKVTNPSAVSEKIPAMKVNSRDDILLPAQQALGGSTIPLNVFASTCFSGQLCKDVAKAGDENINVVSATTDDLPAWSSRNGMDQTALMLSKVMTDPAEFKKASPDGGPLTMAKFQTYVNSYNGTGVYAPGNITDVADRENDYVRHLDIPVMSVLGVELTPGMRIDMTPKQEVQRVGNPDAILIPGTTTFGAPVGGVEDEPYKPTVIIPGSKPGSGTGETSGDDSRSG